MIIVLIISLALVIIFFFSSPHLSPIPYFPTNKKDIPLIIENLKFSNRQVFIDLGAGTGQLIFEAAKKAFEKKLTTKFIAVEINPFLVFILFLKRLFHPNKKNIKIVWKNMFCFALRNLHRSSLIFYTYNSPKFLNKLVRYLQKKFSHFIFISYIYPLKYPKPKIIIEGKIHPIYFYQF